MAAPGDPGPGAVHRTGPRLRSLIGAALLAAAGCGPPQVAPEHRELVLLLATASSTADPEALAMAVAEVAARRAEGTLSADEEAAFGAILSAAEAGDWERARRRAYDLRDAQRPTEAEVDRLKSRPLPPPRALAAPGPSRDR